MITEADIIKFKELYRTETRQGISSEEAFECVRNLVELLRIIYKPIKKNDYEVFSNKLRLKTYGKTMPNIYK